MKEAEVEEQLAQEMSRLSSDDYSQEEADDSGISNTRVLNDVRELKQDGNDIEKTRVIRNIREIQEARTAYQKEMETNSAPSRSRVEQLTQPNHLMIEADSPEIGLEIAKKALKKIHLELGTKNPAAKISGAKLNKKGLFALADKLAGKDLIIENAADLNSGLLDELNRLMAYDETGIIVVLIDTPSRLENLHNQYPALSAYFECIGSQDFQGTGNGKRCRTGDRYQTSAQSNSHSRRRCCALCLQGRTFRRALFIRRKIPRRRV